MIVVNGYVLAIQKTDERYAELLSKINTKPQDPEGYTYNLRADNLEWELVELPPVEPQDEDLTADEALDIILGGGGNET